jgi:hypothetical protein
MPRCFVIQPFDKGEFDKRYDEVFVPAVVAAGLEAYRVDRDPSVIIPIETIEKNIRDADACLADISRENPNVWFEVGYAMACGKEVVLVCMEGSKFPFDVRHRTIITYTTHSPRDFDTLRESITERLLARAKQKQTIEEISSLKPTHGLTNAEMIALALIMENRLTPSDGLYPSAIADDMMKAGYAKFAAALALEGLLRKQLAEVEKDHDYNGNSFDIYKITNDGINWCMKNQNLFVLQQEPPSTTQRGYGVPSRSNLRMVSSNSTPKESAPKKEEEEEDDDIPF